MNTQECDVLNEIKQHSYMNQRVLAEKSGHSLGVVNRCIKELINQGYLNEEGQLTPKSMEVFRVNSPRRAIILAAGVGMRMVPINMETSKALVEIKGETLIERTIKQLHEVGVYEIYVVVGFMKERFEYLIDQYGVELVVNPEYARKNNLHSIKCVLPHLSNSYIVPCDIWCKVNPYHRQELYSWYMVSESVDGESTVRVNRKRELVRIPARGNGNTMLGICYLTEEKAAFVRERVVELCKDARNDASFWEEALCRNNRMIVAAKTVCSHDVVEINTYEQLREMDSDANYLKTEAIQIISKVFQVKDTEITDITVLKKGMTNRSFRFTCKNKKFMMRIPGEGTEHLIDRKQETTVYQTITGNEICEPVLYMNPVNGYKITEFLENARTCDAYDENDVKKCMKRLRQFHNKKLKVDHEFKLFEQIVFYEKLWGQNSSVYADYRETKEKINSLKTYIDAHAEEKVLSHIDAVPDNFLFVERNGEEEIILIDWEYAGMQDPHVDVAMFGIYSLYNRFQMDQLIDAYFQEGCNRIVRTKIYCYIAVCGLLWSNWCEYKRNLGVEFGEYSLRQYRYAKEYYQIAREEMSKLGSYKGECDV